MTVDNAMNVGTLTDSSGASAASETWVGVGGTMTVNSTVTLAGSLLVNGLLQVDNALDVTGSAYVGGLSGGSVGVHLTPGGAGGIRCRLRDPRRGRQGDVKVALGARPAASALHLVQSAQKEPAARGRG